MPTGDESVRGRADPGPSYWPRPSSRRGGPVIGPLWDGREDAGPEVRDPGAGFSGHRPSTRA